MLVLAELKNNRLHGPCYIQYVLVPDRKPKNDPKVLDILLARVVLFLTFPDYKNVDWDRFYLG